MAHPEGKTGESALARAVACDKVDVAMLLIDSGACVNAWNVDYTSCVSMAGMQAHVTLVGMLLDRGADVNIMDTEGYTAMGYAAEEKQSVLVAVLAQAGAHVESYEIGYASPLQLAIETKDVPTVRELLHAGARVDRIGRYNEASVSPEIHTLLLASGLNLCQHVPG
jgi:ankyrin repeat protein